MDSRQQQLREWCQSRLGCPTEELESVSGDASFRRYFRVRLASSDSQSGSEKQSWIAMDAPPDKEDSHSFVALAEHWRRHGIRVPEIIQTDLHSGFLLLEDFGDRVLLPALNPAAPNPESGRRYYGQAIADLLAIQAVPDAPDYPLPPYDEALLQTEMALFRDWLLEKKLGLSLSGSEQSLLDEVFNLLAKQALGQERVPVHRDYHSRNLMILGDDTLGILDFQDAVKGPVTYDLVSLLKDCYIQWPREQVEQWAHEYFDAASARQLVRVEWSDFIRDFDWMGVQRHLKAAGIFARLALRDGKSGYLQDIPRTVNYILDACDRYARLNEFGQFIRSRVIPGLSLLEASA